MSNASNVNFQTKLKEQLGFLERSCNAFDEGFKDEAIRIATIIRVLIHNTNNSTSLLKHLNSTTINLLTTCEGTSENTVSYFGLGVIKISPGSGEHIPGLGNTHYKAFVPVSKWWSQIVYILSSPQVELRRKNIVLTAVNKDGGAHVDSNLTPEYEKLSMDGALGYYFRASKATEETRPFTNSHLVAIRQMGYELLNSPELLKLTQTQN